jgi:hypothetical protein
MCATTVAVMQFERMGYTSAPDVRPASITQASCDLSAALACLMHTRLSRSKITYLLGIGTVGGVEAHEVSS